MNALYQLPYLPADVFLIVITRFLEPIDIVRCRRVSRQWFSAFTNPVFLRYALLWHHRHAREVIQLQGTDDPDASLDTTIARVRATARWLHTFDTVAARYHSLKTGKPQSITKISICEPLPSVIKPCGKRLQIGGEYFRLNFHELSWTYNSGLLVYADPVSQRYVLLDIAANDKTTVPFECDKSNVRRIRLKSNVLIIEWAEGDSWPNSSRNEGVPGHFATAYDIVKLPCSLGWVIPFRSEWRLDLPGSPVRKLDRFFSAHTSTHYAVYTWHASPKGRQNDEPIESLLVWDIQLPSSYRPSDHTSIDRHPDVGPKLIKNFDAVSLDFYDIRQPRSPELWSLKLDEDALGMLYLTEDSNVFVNHCFDGNTGQVALFYRQRVVGIPIAGEGPRWESEKNKNSERSYTRGEWCTRPRAASCWRYKWLPHSIGMKEFEDEPARLSFTLVHSVKSVRSSQVWISGRDWSGNDWTALLDESSQGWLTMHDADIVGEERWIIRQQGDSIQILRFDKMQAATAGPKRRGHSRSIDVSFTMVEKKEII